MPRSYRVELHHTRLSNHLWLPFVHHALFWLERTRWCLRAFVGCLPDRVGKLRECVVEEGDSDMYEEVEVLDVRWVQERYAPN
jgi:hypothetical protein